MRECETIKWNHKLNNGRWMPLWMDDTLHRDETNRIKSTFKLYNGFIHIHIYEDFQSSFPLLALCKQTTTKKAIAALAIVVVVVVALCWKCAKLAYNRFSFVFSIQNSQIHLTLDEQRFNWSLAFYAKHVKDVWKVSAFVVAICYVLLLNLIDPDCFSQRCLRVYASNTQFNG